MPRFPDVESENALAPGCRRCERLVESRACISWGNGSADPQLVVVGEAPGAGDPGADRWQGGNYTGMAYTSRHSGRRVRALFESLGYPPESLYFTNAVKCFPSDGEGSNRAPTESERANCRPYLLREIERTDPDCVVPTGRHATESLLAVTDHTLDGFLETVLSPIVTEPLPPLLPVLHPSYRDVWAPRIGYEDEAVYREAVGTALAGLGVPP
jgi:DNA polymerase